MKTILVPTDFSANANHALRYAIQMAEKARYKILFFHTTLTQLSPVTPNHVQLIKEHIENVTEELKKVVDDSYHALGITRDENTTGFVVKESALVVENLVETAERHEVDMIVMGTQGASGLKKVLLGSNTVGVIEKVNCPVLVIPGGYEFKPILKVGYASDLTDVDNEVSQIISFTRLFDATLDIFHVYPVSPEKVDVAKLDKDKLTDGLSKKFTYPKIRFHLVPTTRTNDVVGGIESFINIYSPAVLVMFTHKRTFFNKFFNPSRTEEIAFQAKVPLLALKG